MAVAAGAARAIDISDVVDRSPIGRFQAGVLVVCGVCLVIDGFDVQAMGYVAPAVIDDWGVAKASLGPVFGAGLFGMLLGSLTFSLLADRLGRRPVLVTATTWFGLCMLATSRASSIDELLWLRLLAGFGLGGVMPNAMALAGEYSPRHVRVTSMMLVSCGFTVGAALGGLAAAALIGAYGWRSVFVAGGLAPLAVAAAMLAFMPESMLLLVLKRRRLDRVRRWLRRIDPSLDVSRDVELVARERDQAGMPAVQLFRDGRARGTVLLWVVNFLNLLDLYFLSNWLPTLLKGAGYPNTRAVLFGTALQLGGVAGTVALGRLVDRRGFGVLVASFAAAAVAILAIGPSAPLAPVLLLAVVVAGFGVVGGQPAVNALAASYYPTALRSTGIGWSLGVGRVGSILGPVLGGYLVGAGWTSSSLFTASALPAFASAAVTAAMLHARPAAGGLPSPARRG